jgi:hypothetical protein
MIIKFNSKFYDLDSIKESINDFKEICSGEAVNKNMEIIVTLNPRQDTPNLKNEFCNYVLGLMKNKCLV